MILDDVQLPRGGHCYETRAVIASKNGPVELNVPVERRGQALIRDTRLAGGRWREKHLKSILMNYPKARKMEQLGAIYHCDWNLLVEFNLLLISTLAKWLDIRAEIVRSSDLGVVAQGTEKIVGIVRALGGDTYISGSGTGSRRYVSEDAFRERGVKLIWHDYQGPNLSAVHSIFSRHPVTAA